VSRSKGKSSSPGGASNFVGRRRGAKTIRGSKAVWGATPDNAELERHLAGDLKQEVAARYGRESRSAGTLRETKNTEERGKRRETEIARRNPEARSCGLIVNRRLL